MENDITKAKKSIDNVIDIITNKKYHNICIATHNSPDGDGIGSMYALSEALKQHGKNVTYIIPDKISPEFSCIIGKKYVNKQLLPPYFETKYDVAFILDVSDLNRTYDKITEISKVQCIIDHHAYSNIILPNDCYYINNNDSSTGMTLFHILKKASNITSDMATALYLTIKSDTDDFRANNTTSETFYTVAELMKYGVDINKINTIYDNNTESYLKLLGIAINNIKIDYIHKMVYLIVRNNDIKISKSNFKEAGLLIDLIKSINGIDMSFLFIESTNQVVIRARSKNFNVANILKPFGGGGHKNSAGCIMYSDDVYRTKDKVIQYAIENS